MAGAPCDSGDSGYVVRVGLVGLCGLGLMYARAIPSGDSGERGESALRNWKRDCCFDGERDSERRICWRCEK